MEPYRAATGDARLRDDAAAPWYGVISDTHGLLRPEALAALDGATAILHAGDVGGARVLDGLRELAPVYAVRGNNDLDPWGRTLPVTDVVDLGPGLVVLVHVIDDLDLDPVAAGVSVVVHGHSHAPSAVERGGVLTLNPGSAGPRRFRLPVTVARLRWEGAPVAEIVELL
ncbi:MAG: phosphoesterase [Myxococcales bacterium]